MLHFETIETSIRDQAGPNFCTFDSRLAGIATNGPRRLQLSAISIRETASEPISLCFCPSKDRGPSNHMRIILQAREHYIRRPAFRLADLESVLSCVVEAALRPLSIRLAANALFIHHTQTKPYLSRQRSRGILHAPFQQLRAPYLLIPRRTIPLDLRPKH